MNSQQNEKNSFFEDVKAKFVVLLTLSDFLLYSHTSTTPSSALSFFERSLSCLNIYIHKILFSQ
jgi:hypothetical protein